MKAIQIDELGTPDVLRWQDVEELPEPAAGYARIELMAVGINYIDIYRRSGAYLESLPLPFIPGQEGAGVVEAVGDGVEGVKVGDRVAYCDILGSYAEVANVPAERLILLPDEISFEQGAALPLQGMTAHYLIHDHVRLKPGSTVLIHAAAGGVGLLTVQWAKHLGAQVIGTVSTEEKANVVRRMGADHAILYKEQDFVLETQRLTQGRGANLVLDGVGRSTFTGSLAAAATYGTVVCYGWASGEPDPIPPLSLVPKSLKLAGDNLVNATATREALLHRASAVIEGVRTGWLHLHINCVLPLWEAAEAHRLLENRKSIGKVILTTKF
jgi:NADPH2:quinone reductase